MKHLSEELGDVSDKRKAARVLALQLEHECIDGDRRRVGLPKKKRSLAEYLRSRRDLPSEARNDSRSCGRPSVEAGCLRGVLQARKLIRHNINLAWAIDGDEEDVCLAAHGPNVRSNVAKEHNAAPQVIDVH